MSWGLARCGAALLTVLAAGTVAAPVEAPEPGRPGRDGRPSYQTATGTMAAYDSRTRVLTLRSAAGSSEFQVAGDARIWVGTRRVPVARLGAYAGTEVTIAWSEREGGRITHTVRVSDTRALLLGAGVAPAAGNGPPTSTAVFAIRGVPQTLHLYGTPGGKAAVVTSGDGGWVHLGPDVAAFLASQGYFVVGFDAKAYLAGFTSRSGPLPVEEVPPDYAALVAYAAKGGAGRPVLVGVSEGAGLSVLAATSAYVQPHIAGVVALGLPERNELGWRFRDSIIYVTRKTPNEPTFSAREVVGHVSPVPLVAIHSTHDEFVPLPEIRGILAQAREPKQLWVVEAANHRFSDNQPELQRRLKEAIAWIESKGSTAP